ncbi:MAG: glutamine synthetase [Colwellia sp.]|nr:glutamine synthetase [Colwellia sp.]
MSLSNTEILNKFLKDHPEIEVFEVMLPDINGKLRGKWIERDNISKIMNGGLKLPLTAIAFDIWGRDPQSWVYQSGDEDGVCIADIRTLAIVPWLKRPTAQIMLSLSDFNNVPCQYDVRNILQNIITRFEQLNLSAMPAFEMEFSLFTKDNDALGQPIHSQKSPAGIDAGQTYGLESMQDMSEFMHGVRDAAKAQNLPIDTLITEAAPSQYEINLHHQPDALIASDQALMLQRTIKGVAKQLNLRASFMAKPFADLAGNGMHMHCSLLDKDGNNAFNNGTDEGNELLQHAIAGCLATLNDCMLIFAPHLNSYRRFKVGSHVPMTATWGYENRTVALRVPAGSHEAMRIEHRVAGADANPYLVATAIIAGMLYGIENKLTAPEAITGNAYTQVPASLPNSWLQSIEHFKKSEFIGQYFGEEFQRVFTATKEQELEEFNNQMTVLEYETYL